MNIKRVFDLIIASALMVLLFMPMLFIACLIKLTSHGPVLYWSDRVGINNSIFKMLKFRTMRTDTPTGATHLLKDPERYLTPIGGFLRRTSLDELPQLINVLKGEISLVGPRPALYNQDDLIGLRTQKGIHFLLPGLTGWAQINGRDEIPIPAKVSFDEYYLRHRSLRFDINILFRTISKAIRGEGIKH